MDPSLSCACGGHTGEVVVKVCSSGFLLPQVVKQPTWPESRVLNDNNVLNPDFFLRRTDAVKWLETSSGLSSGLWWMWPTSRFQKGGCGTPPDCAPPILAGPVWGSLVLNVCLSPEPPEGCLEVCHLSLPGMALIRASWMFATCVCAKGAVPKKRPSRGPCEIADHLEDDEHLVEDDEGTKRERGLFN
jgi:hypothetical protein